MMNEVGAERLDVRRALDPLGCAAHVVVRGQHVEAAGDERGRHAESSDRDQCEWCRRLL